MAVGLGGGRGSGSGRGASVSVSEITMTYLRGSFFGGLHKLSGSHLSLVWSDGKPINNRFRGVPVFEDALDEGRLCLCRLAIRYPKRGLSK